MKVTSKSSRCAVSAAAAAVPSFRVSSSSPSIEQSGLILTRSREGTSTRASANARRRSDAKPSGPANRVSEMRSLSQTRTASCTCASVALVPAASIASSRRAKSRRDGEGVSFTLIYPTPTEDLSEGTPTRRRPFPELRRATELMRCDVERGRYLDSQVAVEN